jgi:hypothetical protein
MLGYRDALAKLDDLARVQVELSGKVHVALRFVDWFARYVCARVVDAWWSPYATVASR